MANRLKMVQKELLFALFSDNWSIRKINKTLGIHRVTIARYKEEWLKSQSAKSSLPSPPGNSDPPLNSYTNTSESVPPGKNQVPTEGVVHFQVPTDPVSESVSKSKAAVFDEKIKEKLGRGQHARSIFQDLVIEDDFQGSYDSVKRYVRKIKHRTPELYARIETPPGYEAQIDFGEGASTLQDGKYKVPWVFVMTLSNSRKSYEEVVTGQDVETFIQCHINAFASLGGVTKTVRHDNLKSAVLKAHLYEPELNPNYLALAEHYGFVPIPCRVRTPEHKGKVESNIDYVQRNALKGKTFESIDAQNRYLRKWNRTWASTRIHGTTKRQVNLMFEEERPHLKPLPEIPFVFFKIGTRKVSSMDSHIEVQGAYYPIPPHYMGKRVNVHYNSRWVKVFYQEKMIQHLSVVPKGRFHPDKSCLPPHKNWTQQRYVQYLMNRCAVIGPAVLKWAKLAVVQRQERAYRSIQGVVALSKKYPYRVIEKACSRCVEQHVFSYHIVKERAKEACIQEKIQKELKFTQESQFIRSPLEYQNMIRGEDHG